MDLHGVAAWRVILGFVLGVFFVLLGVWILWWDRLSKRLDRERGASQPWAGRLTEPTRLTLGVAAMVAGYHIASYMAPEEWLDLCVPRERWWMLVLGLLAAVGGSLWVDRRTRWPVKGAGDVTER